MKNNIIIDKSGKASDVITVTKPALPELSEFLPYLEKIWENKWLTNNGQFHQELEIALAEFLGIKHISLCSNGTLALILALKALDLDGEIITTPFSFVATAHAMKWIGCTPVFSDIDPITCNLDPNKIESKITDKTVAILPVHVYGNPCDNEKIQAIADKYDLKLIYDAAHAFHVQMAGESILNWGDLSVLSFHATKVFNTFEGGAVISKSAEMKKKVDDLKNFGFQNETTVSEIGINAKMNEVQAAMGLAQLNLVESNIAKRKEIARLYDKRLDLIDGIDVFKMGNDIRGNYSYYPIKVDKSLYGISRDELYEKLKDNKIFSRKYFYPLISSFPMYSNTLDNDLPIAEEISGDILCLPIYPDLSIEDLDKICSIIESNK